MSTGSGAGDDDAPLLQQVAELKRENEVLRQRLDGFSRQFDLIKTALTGRNDLGRLEQLGEDDNFLDRLDAAEDRLHNVETIAYPGTDGKDYADMHRDELAVVIRQALVDKARKNGGKASFTYKEVHQRLDGKVSTSHCYNVMDAASRADGFAYDTSPTTGQKRVTVDIATVNDPATLSRCE